MERILSDEETLNRLYRSDLPYRMEVTPVEGTDQYVAKFQDAAVSQPFGTEGWPHPIRHLQQPAAQRFYIKDEAILASVDTARKELLQASVAQTFGGRVERNSWTGHQSDAVLKQFDEARSTYEQRVGEASAPTTAQMALARLQARSQQVRGQDSSSASKPTPGQSPAPKPLKR